MKISFTKMTALGNDFVVIPAQHFPPEKFTAPQLTTLADRHFGVGCDQILFVAPQVDVCDVRIFNQDGTESHLCGNGLRSLVVYLNQEGPVHLRAGHQIFTGEMMEAALPSLTFPRRYEMKTLNADGLSGLGILSVTYVHVGNAHLVVWMESLPEENAQFIVDILRKSYDYPDGVNIHLVAGSSTSPEINMLHHEQGVGWTHSCGSGALSATIVAQELYGYPDAIVISLTHGKLNMTKNRDDTYTQVGPAHICFTGEITL